MELVERHKISVRTIPIETRKFRPFIRVELGRV